MWSQTESKFDSYEARFVKVYIKSVQELIERQAAVKAYLEWMGTQKYITNLPVPYQFIDNPFNNIAERQQHTESKRKQKLEVIFFDSEKKIKEIFLEYKITSFWHLTHKSNIHSIIKNGILNHSDAYQSDVVPIDISDPGAQQWRDRTEPLYKRKIHDYANLYINPRNPMLYARKELQVDLCLVEISLSVLAENQYLMTDGNAASHDTKFYSSASSLELLPWDVLRAGYWNDLPDGKRKRCAEVLVYPKIPPKFIVRIHCYSNSTLDLLYDCGQDILVTKNLFF